MRVVTFEGTMHKMEITAQNSVEICLRSCSVKASFGATKFFVYQNKAIVVQNDLALGNKVT